MEEPDLSLERIFEAGLSGAGFKLVAPLPAFEAGLLLVPTRVATGTDRFSAVIFTADFAVVFTADLLFTVVPGALTTTFADVVFVAVFSVPASGFASLRVTVFATDASTRPDAVLALGGTAVPPPIFFASRVFALFTEVLVTVAFMASSFQCTARPDRRPPVRRFHPDAVAIFVPVSERHWPTAAALICASCRTTTSVA
jgi:hypothetical protein